jgi:hypothetical protein
VCNAGACVTSNCDAVRLLSSILPPGHTARSHFVEALYRANKPHENRTESSKHLIGRLHFVEAIHQKNEPELSKLRPKLRIQLY